jgi:hypothetical protein
MTYANEMGLVVMTYIPSFINTGSDIQRLIRGYTQRQREDGDHSVTKFRVMNCDEILRRVFLILTKEEGRISRSGRVLACVCPYVQVRTF